MLDTGRHEQHLTCLKRMPSPSIYKLAGARDNDIHLVSRMWFLKIDLFWFVNFYLQRAMTEHAYKLALTNFRKLCKC